jgi:hypothetical protein
MRAIHLRRRTRWLLPLVASTLAACGSGDGFQGAGGVRGPLQPNFDSIQANVFEPLCEHCHAGANAPRGLRLDAANSYALLVGVPAGQRPTLQRVAPGDPNNSYIVQKLEGTAGIGERMPAGLPALPQSDIDVIRQWIAAGALPSAAASGPIRVTALTPAPRATELALPGSITAVFNRDLNATTVTTGTFRLERAGPDRALGTSDDIGVTPASVGVPTGNPRAAVMDLTGVASALDTYRVTLAGSGPATIMDLAGNSLDGEFGAALPSGDGSAGGNFVATFTVAGTLPTLSSIHANVLAVRCATSGCHDGGGALLPRSMNLTTAAAAHAALVGVASVQVPSLQRVSPGNPADSYLIRKLEGAPGIVGVRMPRPIGAPPLEQATIDAIRLWITNGAQHN